MTKSDKLKAALLEVRAIAAKADEEDRDFTDTERAEITAKMKALETLKADVGLEKALADFAGDIEAIDPQPSRGAGGENVKPLEVVRGQSIGAAFSSSKGYRSWLDSMPKGSSPARVGSSPAFELPGGLKALERRAKGLVTGVSDTSAGATINNQFLGLLDEGVYARPLTLLDYITRGTTGSDAVEYARVTSTTNAAAPVAESSAVDDASGVKPESAIVLEKITAAVKTIAHWLPATKRAISDAGQLMTLIDGFLTYGLYEELEDQIVNGDGTGENFDGILGTSGVQAQAFDTDILTTARKAKTLIKVNARATANAYMFHPNDAETLDLLKDLEGRFYFGGPADDGVQRLWRLPVIETEAMTEGTALVGDFRRAVLWDREQASISVTDSHSDFFVRNIIAILAELRAAFGVTRPAAFATIDLAAGS